MYVIVYLFRLFLVDRAFKEMLDSLGMPVPVSSSYSIGCHVKMEANAMPTQEMQDEFIRAAEEKYVGLGTDEYVVVKAQFDRIEKAYFASPKAKESVGG